MPMIDLGKEMSSPCCDVKPSEKMPEKYYPTIYMEGVGDLELPEEGEAIVKFKMVRDTKDMKTGKHDLVLEIREIGDYKTPRAREEYSDRGADLDKLRKMLAEHKED